MDHFSEQIGVSVKWIGNRIEWHFAFSATPGVREVGCRNAIFLAACCTGSKSRHLHLPNRLVSSRNSVSILTFRDIQFDPRLTEQNDALAVMAISRIIRERDAARKAGKLVDNIIPRQAYILRSLKNPDELKTLRETYGEAFYLVAAYSPRRIRKEYLALRIAAQRRRVSRSSVYDKAEALIQRDEVELEMPHGQNVRGIFHRADVFIDASADVAAIRESLRRFVHLIFGNTFNTPRRREYSMFLAHGASLRSAELGRQVGAVIATDEGDIVAVGCNEVPKAGGGTYWCGDEPDRREFVEEHDTEAGTHRDSNEENIRAVIRETLSDLKDAGWLSPDKALQSNDDLLEKAIAVESLKGIAKETVAQVLRYLKSAQWLNPAKSALSDDELLISAIAGQISVGMVRTRETQNL